MSKDSVGHGCCPMDTDRDTILLFSLSSAGGPGLPTGCYVTPQETSCIASSPEALRSVGLLLLQGHQLVHIGGKDCGRERLHLYASVRIDVVLGTQTRTGALTILLPALPVHGSSAAT